MKKEPVSQDKPSVELIDDEHVDVYIGETDPLSYRPHQVEGMMLSLLYGSAPSSSVRKDAQEFSRMFFYQTHSDSDPVTFARLGLGQAHSITSMPSTKALPIVNVSRKQDENFIERLENLMYDKKNSNPWSWDVFFIAHHISSRLY